jgi:hypothetical protein
MLFTFDELANPTASPKKSLVAQRVGSSGPLADSSPRRRIELSASQREVADGAKDELKRKREGMPPLTLGSLSGSLNIFLFCLLMLFTFDELASPTTSPKILEAIFCTGC